MTPPPALRGLRDRDLIVVGPKGRGFRKSLHLGSTSDALLNRPPMPLVIARHGVTTKRALVCADGSADCHAAVEALRVMPWLEQVHVLVVSVPQPGLDAPRAAENAADVLRSAASSVRTQVAEPDELQIVVNPRAMLLDAALRWQADLIVLGTRGLSGMAAFSAGSIAASLARRAACSVLAARAEPARPGDPGAHEGTPESRRRSLAGDGRTQSPRVNRAAQLRVPPCPDIPLACATAEPK